MKARGSDVSEELYTLSVKLFQNVYMYPSCVINGMKFITFRRDEMCITQNSGLSVLVDDYTFYGKMYDVVLNYRHDCQVVLL